LLDTIVFGKTAGAEAARFAKQGGVTGDIKKNKEAPPSQLKKSNVDNQKKGSDDNGGGGVFVAKEPLKFRNEIQELMKQNAGIVREQTRLQNGLKRILELKDEFYSNNNKDNVDIKEFKIDDNNNFENVVLSWQVKSSLIACEAIIRSVLMRQESRGAHYRSDFPKLDDERWKEREYLQLQQQRKWYCLNIMLRKSKDRSQICFNHMSKLHTIVHLNSSNNNIIEKRKIWIHF
jgi:succinate dehydrogenase/fumarate reductase flavoprotein subunit